MKCCLLVGIGSDDLYWTVVTPELFKTICEEINQEFAKDKKNRHLSNHPNTYVSHNPDTFRDGVIEEFFTQAWTTGDIATNLKDKEVQEILTYTE